MSLPHYSLSHMKAGPGSVLFTINAPMAGTQEGLGTYLSDQQIKMGQTAWRSAKLPDIRDVQATV